MNSIRRALVAVFVLGLVRPLAALAAWNKEAFSAKSAGDALKNLGIANAQPSKDLTVEIPEIAVGRGDAFAAKGDCGTWEEIRPDGL